jgi:hypothetical protein
MHKKHPDSASKWIIVVRLLAALLQLVRQLSDNMPTI